MGIETLAEKYHARKSEVVRTPVMLLAKAWAKEVFKDEEPMTWEFKKGTLTQREIIVIDNMENLQFSARLDSVSRLQDTNKKKVTSQSVDLKTGIPFGQSTMMTEVSKRQFQTMRHLSERFAGKYLVDFKNLEPRREGFFLKTEPTSKAYNERVNFAGSRHINRDTGEMSIQEETMEPFDRKGFNEWLDWYGRMNQQHRGEIASLIENKTRFILQNIDLDKSKLDFSE